MVDVAAVFEQAVVASVRLVGSRVRNFHKNVLPEQVDDHRMDNYSSGLSDSHRQ
jgi:hypothetical protein